MKYPGKKRNTLLLHLLYPMCFSVVLFHCSEERIEPPFSLLMLNKINEVRAEGCMCGPQLMPSAPAIEWNEALQSAALAHAHDMFSRDYFNHVSPEGTSPHERVYRMDYQGQFLYENIASGYTAIETVVEAWLKSESHCRAIMDSSVHETGVAEFNEYWVMELGRRKTD